MFAGYAPDRLGQRLGRLCAVEQDDCELQCFRHVEPTADCTSCLTERNKRHMSRRQVWQSMILSQLLPNNLIWRWEPPGARSETPQCSHGATAAGYWWTTSRDVGQLPLKTAINH